VGGFENSMGLAVSTGDRLSRRGVLGALTCMGLAGCVPAGRTGRVEVMWGKYGRRRPGDFNTPRAMAVSPDDEVYVCDKEARIQVFTADGKYLREWQTPEQYHGRPTGMSFDRKGRLAVADTHYYRVLFYEPGGKLVETLGGMHGSKPGQFNWITDVAEDELGNLIVSEYGDADRIQLFDAKRKPRLEWGHTGRETGEFSRPQSIAIARDGRIFIADACNHRIQVFRIEQDKSIPVAAWGELGAELGQLRYPYGIVFNPEGELLVCEWGNNRVSKFTPEGKPLGAWGGLGREKGQLSQPWSVAVDSRGRTYVLDSYNHRVQRIAF
jgi:DNA-binding beta-propeller fold protein YncE